MTHPERESLAQHAEAERNMGSYAFAAQYQQQPAPSGGGMVLWDWFRSYDPVNLPVFTRTVQSWDTANKDGETSDYSVCVTFGETRDRQWYILDIYRGRLLFPELQRKVRELAELHKASTVLIEDCASGTQLVQQLRQQGFARLFPITPKGSKYEWLISCSAKIEAGKVWIPNQAHWIEPFKHELTLFPNSRHKDQADALSQGLLWLGDCSGGAYWLWMMEEVGRMRREQR